MDSQNKAPIEYATIVIKKGTEVLDGTISKKDGSFEISINPKSNYIIDISFLGYETQSIDSFEIEKGNMIALGEILLCLHKLNLKR